MYGFENETYLKVLHGAVDNIEVIKDIIEKVEEKSWQYESKRRNKNMDSVCFCYS